MILAISGKCQPYHSCAQRDEKKQKKNAKRNTYLHSHGVNVDFLVEIIKESDSLNDHSVDLVRGEFELEPGQTACKDFEK
jgi:hypothetical protein